MMFFAQLCAYYFAAGIRYIGHLNKISTSFFRAYPTLRLFFSIPGVGYANEIFVE